MNNNEITNVDSKRESTYEQDLSEIKNELVDKLTKLFNEFVHSSIVKGDQTNNYHTITHILYLICMQEKYYKNPLLYDLDCCVDDLLCVYSKCISKKKSYKKSYERYKQEGYCQEECDTPDN